MVILQQRVTVGWERKKWSGASQEPKESERVRLPKESPGHIHKGTKTFKMRHKDKEEREGTSTKIAFVCQMKVTVIIYFTNLGNWDS